MLPQSFEDQRPAFERAIFHYYTNLKAAGWSADGEGDFSSEALLWRHEDGRYGVRQIEAAWVGWLLARFPLKAAA